MAETIHSRKLDDCTSRINTTCDRIGARLDNMGVRLDNLQAMMLQLIEHFEQKGNPKHSKNLGSLNNSIASEFVLDGAAKKGKLIKDLKRQGMHVLALTTQEKELAMKKEEFLSEDDFSERELGQETQQFGFEKETQEAEEQKSSVEDPYHCLIQSQMEPTTTTSNRGILKDEGNWRTTCIDNREHFNPNIVEEIERAAMIAVARPSKTSTIIPLILLSARLDLQPPTPRSVVPLLFFDSATPELQDPVPLRSKASANLRPLPKPPDLDSGMAFLQGKINKKPLPPITTSIPILPLSLPSLDLPNSQVFRLRPKPKPPASSECWVLHQLLIGITLPEDRSSLYFPALNTLTCYYRAYYCWANWSGLTFMTIDCVNSMKWGSEYVECRVLWGDCFPVFCLALLCRDGAHVVFDKMLEKVFISCVYVVSVKTIEKSPLLSSMRFLKCTFALNLKDLAEHASLVFIIIFMSLNELEIGSLKKIEHGDSDSSKTLLVLLEFDSIEVSAVEIMFLCEKTLLFEQGFGKLLPMVEQRSPIKSWFMLILGDNGRDSFFESLLGCTDDVSFARGFGKSKIYNAIDRNVGCVWLAGHMSLMIAYTIGIISCASCCFSLWQFVMDHHLMQGWLRMKTLG